jgi:hypothetical protein
MGGGDRSIVHYIAPSIESYLTDHLNKLRNDWFFTLRKQIECFPSNPTQNFGSLTITNGIKIEACAKYFHFLNEKDFYDN